MTLSFMVLRSYAREDHSDSRIFCYLGSNLVLLIPVYTEKLPVWTDNYILTILLAALGVLWYMAQDAYAYAIYSSICITAF